MSDDLEPRAALVPVEAALVPAEPGDVAPLRSGASLKLLAASSALPAAAAVASQLPAAMGQTFRALPTRALQALQDGGSLMAGDAGVYGQVVGADGKIVGKLQFTEVTGQAQGVAAAMGALQIVSFAVGQYHLHEISGSLKSLKAGLDELDQRQDDQERARLRSAATFLEEVVAHERAGNSIEPDREHLAAARRDVDEVLDAALARAERVMQSAVRAAAIAAHAESVKDREDRIRLLREQRDLMENLLAKLRSEPLAGALGSLVERAPIRPLLSRLRSARRNVGEGTNEFSDDIERLAGRVADLAERIERAESDEEAGTGSAPDTRTLARLIDELTESAPRVLSAMEIVSDAAHLSCLLVVMAAMADQDGDRQALALELAADHFTDVGTRLRGLDAALPSVDELASYQQHIKRSRRRIDDAVEAWRPVTVATATSDAIGELLEAAATDDLVLRMTTDGQLELCRAAN